MTKYDQTTVNLPADTKRAVRIVAANMGVSMGRAALKLIELGLQEIEQPAGENVAGAVARTELPSDTKL
jgi:plasmid stability protein